MRIEETGVIHYELLQLKEKISLLQTFLGQFCLPSEGERAVASAFKELLKAVERIANLLNGECKNDTV